MDADLTATPTFDNGQVTGWQLCYKQTDCGTGRSSSPYPKLDFTQGSGDHTIKISIANGNGITFAQTNPLWIQPGTKPTGPIVAPTSQINPSKITGAGTTELKFHDKNSDAMTLKYQLNFQGAPGVMSIDPDILNGGKGRPWYETSAAWMVTGAVAIVLVLAVLVWRRNARRRMAQ